MLYDIIATIVGHHNFVSRELYIKHLDKLSDCSKMRPHLTLTDPEDPPTVTPLPSSRWDKRTRFFCSPFLQLLYIFVLLATVRYVLTSDLSLLLSVFGQQEGDSMSALFAETGISPVAESAKHAPFDINRKKVISEVTNTSFEKRPSLVNRLVCALARSRSVFHTNMHFF